MKQTADEAHRSLCEPGIGYQRSAPLSDTHVRLVALDQQYVNFYLRTDVELGARTTLHGFNVGTAMTFDKKTH